MKKAILGKKLGMTQMFAADGTLVPVTVVQAGPCPVTQVKTVEHDGYKAIQVGFMPIREKLVTKPRLGQFKRAGLEAHRYIKELKLDDNYEVGQVITAEMFEAGDMIDVTAKSKGKGFQGVIKRYGQSRGRMTHGSRYHRRVGSMSACSYPGEVFKHKRLPGHMGSVQVTVQNLEVVRVDAQRNLLLVKGAIPGAKGTLVTVKSTVK